MSAIDKPIKSLWMFMDAISHPKSPGRSAVLGRWRGRPATPRRGGCSRSPSFQGCLE